MPLPAFLILTFPGKYSNMNKTLHKIYIASFFLISILVTFLFVYNGYSYYTTPLDHRFFMPQNNMLKPSGFIGHGAGILGSLMMIVGVSVYMVRKRIRRFHGFGYLSNWLEFHIFLCTLGPILVLFHTAFKFGGIVAVSFWSMTAVVLSGVVGRFLYVQIPRTIQGQVIDFKELQQMSDRLNDRLKGDFNVSPAVLSMLDKYSSFESYTRLTPVKSLKIIFYSYLRIKIILRKLKQELRINRKNGPEINEIVKTAKSKLVLSRRIGLLKTTQKIFRYWHVVHLPFAIIMFIIMFVHIAVTIIFGYRWIF